MNKVLTFCASLFTASVMAAPQLPNLDQAERACASGNVQGCADLSMHHLNAGNRTEAKKLASAACKSGATRGCNVLGIISNAEGNNSEARSLFKGSCEKDDLRGCIQFAMMLHKDGDKEDARDLLKRVCEGGEIIGCTLQGEIERELGNNEVAGALFKRACQGEEMTGCNHLAAMEKGKGNTDEAHRLWSRACERGIDNACSALESDIQEKMRLYGSACDGGDLASCVKYGLARESLPSPIDWSLEKEQILQQYQKACSGGEPSGCGAIKTFLIKACVEKQKRSETGCYMDGPQKRSGASIVIPKVRINNPVCDAKLKEAGKGLGCTSVGDFEAKRGNFKEAERIYSEGCTNKKNSGGCGGLVCIAYRKMREGNQAASQKLLRQACNSAGYIDGQLESCSELFSTEKKPARSRLPTEIRNREVEKAEERCQAGWKRAWG